MRNKNEAIDRGHKALLARLAAELRDADDESSTEQFLAAEAAVDRYLDAVAQRTISLTVSQDLAFACAVLLITTQAVERRDGFTRAALRA